MSALQTDPSESLIFVEIPYMCVSTGYSDINAFDDEGSKQLCVDPFSVMETPITVKMFEQFVSITGYQTDSETGKGGLLGCWNYGTNGGYYDKNTYWRNPGFIQNGNHPVVCISKNDIDSFKSWLSKNKNADLRLPTEAEMVVMSSFYVGILDEYNICSFGNVLDKESSKRIGKITDIKCSDGYVFTSEVKAFPPTKNGLYDIIGNVWEWTCSKYSHSWDGSEMKCEKNGVNFISRRGGGWIDTFRSSRPTVRYRGFRYLRYNFLGFRLVKE